MTEAEWLNASNTHTMLRHLSAKTSKRKLRLFAAACWRCRCRDMVSFGHVRSVIRKAEEIADGTRRATPGGGGWVLLQSGIYQAAQDTVSTTADIRGKGRVPLVESAGLLRDIFGNPFRPVVVDPGWLTSDVRALARGIYDERAFDRMPILADALQDAGCANDDVLSHCRGSGPHVRGCWVVDLLLGKT